MTDVYIAGAARTAVGRLGGALRDVPEENLGSAVIAAALARSGLAPDQVDEVVLAQNYRSGRTASNIARVAALQAGIPRTVPQYTVNKHCGGGLRALISAVQAIKAGDARVAVAGGVESMSRAAPLLPHETRWGFRMGNLTWMDPLTVADPLSGLTMGETAERVAETFDIGREEQDRFALRSQERAEAAVKAGRFQDEIEPIPLPTRGGQADLFAVDEQPRFGTTLAKLAALRPVFRAGGTVTAGNASTMNDGAAALVLMGEQALRGTGVQPLGRIRSYAACGVDPAVMGIAPVPATRLALERAGLNLEDMDIIELNEAFAAICIYYQRELQPDPERLNVNGGAIALGHPIAATGAILVVKALYELRRRRARYALVTMCIGGGQGIALVLERI